MILGGNKPVQRPASNSESRKRQQGDPHAWPTEALERVLEAVENLTPEEAELGESSTDALQGAPRALPHVSDGTSWGFKCCEHCLGVRESGHRTPCSYGCDS